MLDARAEVGEFTGRDAELGALGDWRDSGECGVDLVTDIRHAQASSQRTRSFDPPSLACPVQLKVAEVNSGWPPTFRLGWAQSEGGRMEAERHRATATVGDATSRTARSSFERRVDLVGASVAGGVGLVDQAT